MTKGSLLFIVALALSFGAGFLAERKLHECPTIPEPRIDTLWRHDTTTLEKPVAVRTTVVDTMYLPVLDTLVERDTVFLKLPKQERVYEDSLFYAVVSGYEPSLDTLRVVKTTQYITTIQKVVDKRRFGIGVYGGYGAAAHGGAVYLAPQIGIGIHYDFLRF